MRELGVRVGLFACVLLLIVAMAIQEWRLTRQVQVLTVKVTEINALRQRLQEVTGTYERPVPNTFQVGKTSLGTLQYEVDHLEWFLGGVCQAGYFQYNCGVFFGRLGR